jgi:hypothetical protein
LSLQETAGYLAGRIRAAGGVGAQVFTREAVTLIHERSLGVPRTISVIADNALLTGFAVGQRPVNSSTVREVCRDFDLGPGAQGTVPAGAAGESPTSAIISVSRAAAGAAAAQTGGADRPASATTGQKAPESGGSRHWLFSLLKG